MNVFTSRCLAEPDVEFGDGGLHIDHALGSGFGDNLFACLALLGHGDQQVALNGAGAGLTAAQLAALDTNADGQLSGAELNG